MMETREMLKRVPLELSNRGYGHDGGHREGLSSRRREGVR